MEWRLAQRGFKLLPVDKWAQSGSYDLICALNLLDRHHDPMQLLSDIHRLALESGGGSLVLLSLVLPVKQFVEFAPSNGSVGTTAAQSIFVFTNFKKKTFLGFPIFYKGNLLAPNCCEGYGHNLFEAQASALVRDVFEPTGFQLLRWTKLPYLCEGDLARVSVQCFSHFPLKYPTHY
jgi:SAM-dependent methyltransferase